MKKSIIVIILLAILAGLVLAGALLLARKPEEAVSVPAPHAYGDPEAKIGKIGLKVFYAVPKNEVHGIPKDWQKQIERVLGEVANFHSAQFHQLSKLSSEVYPEPVILENDNGFYDTSDTNYGNPEGLRRIVPELERRFPVFLKPTEGSFSIIAVVYEGVGAAGAPNAMILSRDFLSDPDYLSVSSALFYHEFGHSLGLQEKYDLATNQPFSNDIMGRGRLRPLTTGYIDPASINEMGLSYFKVK